MGSPSFTYDVASALWQGMRKAQEDTLSTDFHAGSGHGFAVLADGMGGHAAGDLASRLVVIDASSHLKFLMQDPDVLEGKLQDEFRVAINTANTLLSERAEADQSLRGMGTTFLSIALFEDRLYWASVGDSPLFLFRGGKLRQLNEDHSLAPVIAQMVERGELSEEDGRKHPDRNALTSVLMGRNIKQMDIPAKPLKLDPGDLVICASDGLQFLTDEQIAAEIDAAGPDASSARICDRLIAALKELAHPHQDNTAIAVVRLIAGAPSERKAGDPITEPAPYRTPLERYLPEPGADRDADAGADDPRPMSRMLVDAPAEEEAPEPVSAAQEAAPAEREARPDGAPGWLVPLVVLVVLIAGAALIWGGGGTDAPTAENAPATQQEGTDQ